MKRYCAFLLLFLVALSTLTPLLGAKTAQAQTQARNPETNSNIEMSDVFKDRENKTNGSDFWLGKQSATITGQGFKTTAKLQATLTLDTQFSPAEDDKKDGVFNKGDYLGGWNAILDDDRIGDLALQNNNGDGSGIFLQLFEVGKGETLAGAGDGDVSKAIKQGGPYYSSDRLKIPFISTVGEFNRSIFVRGQGQFNIGPFFWFISPTQNFFGKRAVSTNIVLTDLKPDTKYYYRLILAEDWSSDESYTQITEQTSFTTDSTKADPSLEELQAISGTSNGSSVDGNASADIFGDRVECTIYPITWFGCFAIGYYNTIYYISSWLLRAAAGLMDIFMAYSLSSFIYQNSFINTGWTVVRDVCNILFIFILLWTAFKMVINDHHHRAQEVIVQIIVVGLLINFSLFFSKVIIDMGNISARVFYNQIRITGSAQNTQDEVAQAIQTNDLAPKAISEALANGLDITAIGNKGFEMLQTEAGGFIPLGTVWLLLLLGTAINITAAWIFVKVSFAFLGRIFSLWMGMIFSPFAFTSTIISGGHGLGHGPMDIKKVGWSDWLKNMLEAAFYPAVFLFFVFLIILLINDNFFAGMVGDTEKLSATAYLIVTIFKFIFIIGLIKVAGDFASKMSGMFGGEISAVAGKAAAFVGGAAIGVATGGAAWAGRNTIGRAAGVLGTEDRIANLQEKAKKGGVGGYFARQGLKTIQGAQKASFDARQTGAANKLSAATGMNMDALGRVPGLGFLSTTGSAGGLEGARERKMAKIQARAESLGENDKKKKEIKKLIEKRETEITAQEEIVARNKQELAQDKANGGANQAALTQKVGDAEKALRALKKTPVWTREDAGTPGGPNGVPPAIPARRKADGTAVTLDDVGKVQDIPRDKLGLEELKKALNNNSKALAREYMSNQIRRQSASHISDDTKDQFGNITEFGHAHGLETTNQLLRRMVQGMNPYNRNTGISMNALVSGTLSNASAVMGLRNAVADFTERRTNDYIHDADHATAVSDGKDHGHHGPKYKSTYKGPTMNIFSGLFGGGGGGGGGHDDHGHDDHGGGGHH
jgi:hypothetical protein